MAPTKMMLSKREFFDASVEYEDTEDDWVVGGSAILKVSDMFRIEAAASFGEGMQEFDQWSSQDNENDMEHWNASRIRRAGLCRGLRLRVRRRTAAWSMRTTNLL